jgi:GNAT superfamily N-acetyltransferase
LEKLNVVRLTNEDHADLDVVRSLFADYQTELGIDLCFQGFAEELRDLPGPYREPEGRLFLYRVDGENAGVGALKPLSDGSVELKRIYLRPDFRGKGLGKRITEHLLTTARDLGYSLAKLDTLARLKPAVQLYRRLGFVETTPYNENPEPDILYFELILS